MENIQERVGIFKKKNADRFLTNIDDGLPKASR